MRDVAGVRGRELLLALGLCVAFWKTDAEETSAPSESPAIQDKSAAAVPSSQGLQEALLIVSSKEGAGSGFIARMNDANYLITNAHVIAGASSLQTKALSGQTLTPGKGRLAVDHDLVAFEAENVPLSLDIATDVGKQVSIGDEVVIYGNSLGASVVTELRGKVTGIGPNEIEVDAPFVPGNSGSPIIHIKSGKVIGIASYIRTEKGDKLTKDSGIKEVRRFGYRLDTITQWQDLNWPVFQREAAIVQGIEEFTDDYAAFWEYVDKKDPSAMELGSRNHRLQRQIRNFQSGINRKISDADFHKALTGFLKGLRNESQQEFLPGRPVPQYWFLKKKWSEQKQVREEISKDLGQDIQERQTRAN
ncbi:MAG: S1C family serine protease [Terrimicrobiaceae bacterium]